MSGATQANTGTDIIEIFKQRTEQKKSDNTAKIRANHLEQFRAWLRANDRRGLLDVNDYDIKDHFDSIRGTHPDKYAASRLDAISAFFRWLENDENRLREQHDIDVAVSENPAKGILSEYRDMDYSTLKSRVYEHDIVALDRDDADRLTQREHVPDPKTRNLLIIKLFLQTGVRRSEIRQIKLSDINRDERRIRVTDVKNNRRRTVFYQPSVEKLMHRWIEGGLRDTFPDADESDYLFLTHRSEQISTTALRNLVHKAADNAGIQEPMYEDASGSTRYKVSPHTLRHTFARFAVTGDNSMDLPRLARLMGHMDKQGNPNIETTQKYLAFNEDDLRTATQACIPDM